MSARLRLPWRRSPARAPAAAPAPAPPGRRVPITGDGPPPPTVGEHLDVYRDRETGAEWAMLGRAWCPCAVPDGPVRAG
jgi:hypothetical protein